MTIRVTIKHEDDGHTDSIQVTKYDVQSDTKHEGITHHYISETNRVIPGGSLTTYIWGEQYLKIEEVK